MAVVPRYTGSFGPGEDPHDLVVKRVGSDRRWRVEEIESGGEPRVLDLRFRAGRRYVMWCSTLDGVHRAQGMEAELRVRDR